MSPNLKTTLLVSIIAVSGITGGCATVEQASVDAAASTIPDPDLAVARPDFAMEIALYAPRVLGP